MAAVVTVVLALGVGISLGLLGGGGSVLSVPLLVYVAGWTPHQAATGSLFVVGVTSAVSLIPHARQGRVAWRTGAVVGVAGMVGAYAGGRLAAGVPGDVLLAAFAGLMVLAATGMIRGRRGTTAARGTLRIAPALALGLAIGTTTGFVGAGGGFAIVPALVLVAGLPMARAVGTSLLVIALQSAAGLAGHLPGTELPWRLAVAVTAAAVVGSFVGARWTGRVPADTLRRWFGIGVLGVAGLVVVEEAPQGARPAAAVLLAATAFTLAVAASRRRPTPPPVTTQCQENPMSATSSRPGSSMVFTQYYIDCLSQASYLIGDTSTGQAVVVDPRRDIQEYLDDAAAAGLTIVGMINTHFHADFLSGHLELARASGAWIGYGRVAQAEFETRALAHRERIGLGDVVLEILETPGHTPESISVLVYEHADDEVAYGVLTGDTLFIGDVGRPDLLASIGVTADELGRQLYRSVQQTLMGLPNPVRVFPGHGAGSACGKNLSTERQSTIGMQRQLNYACRPMQEQEFLALVTAGQPAAPEYFVYDAILNRKLRDVRETDARPSALDGDALDAALARGAVVLDARSAPDFAAGHLVGSVNVPADGRFAETAGMMLSPEEEVVVLAPDGRADEVALRLARIGFDRTSGYVDDPEAALLARSADVQQSSRVTAGQLAELLRGDDAPVVLDVRNSGERETGLIEGSLHVPLAELRRRLAEVPADRPVVVHCAGGWRSSVAASFLRRAGRDDVSDLLGGYAAWAGAHEAVGA